MELLTVAQIIRATDFAPDEAKRRRRRFFLRRELGLIGAPRRKVARRGGEGLWHPAQAALWRLYERDSKRVRPPTLANAPVGAWLLGTDGVELAQVQRAFGYWARKVSRMDRPPAGDRSGHRRRVDEAARHVAGPHAARQTRRELSSQFQIVSDTQSVVRPGPLTSSIRATLSTGEYRTEEVDQFASTYANNVRFRFLALENLVALTSASAEPLWLWVRRLIKAEYAAYMNEQPRLHQLPSAGRFYSDTPDTNYFVNHACESVLQRLGVAVAVLAGESVAGLLVPFPPPEVVRQFKDAWKVH